MPDAILDWVALNSYRIHSDDAPALTGRSARGISETFAYPKSSQAERRMEYLLAPYLLRVGQRTGISRYVTLEDA